MTASDLRFNPDAAAHAIANRWLRIAIVYFVIAVLLGVVMGASGDHRLAGVHVHLNLLGWASMALIAFAYRSFPRAATTRMARASFWIYQLALPPMMIALGLYLTGTAAAEPVLGLTSIAVGVAVLLFAVNVLRQRD